MLNNCTDAMEWANLPLLEHFNCIYIHIYRRRCHNTHIPHPGVIICLWHFICLCVDLNEQVCAVDGMHSFCCHYTTGPRLQALEMQMELFVYIIQIPFWSLICVWWWVSFFFSLSCFSSIVGLFAVVFSLCVCVCWFSIFFLYKT